MTTDALLLSLLDEAYSKKTWHGPNLRQSLKGVSAKQAAWRPGRGRHNIWEIALHAAYWKYAVRRRLAGGKRGAFVLKGSNFFTRPENGDASEAAWRGDRATPGDGTPRTREGYSTGIEHPSGQPSAWRMIYGVAFHDVYHAGQVRLLRRLMEP